MTASEAHTERVGIFGGSFNPPHLAHLIVAECLREQFELDRVLWIPNQRSPLKDEVELASTDHRLAMTRLAVHGNEAFSVSEIETRRDGPSYTIDTVRALQGQKPDTSFHLLVGSDSLASLDQWRAPEDLLERVPFIVFPRPGDLKARPPEGYEHRISFADAPLLAISSTEIRWRLRSGRSVRYLMPRDVVEYIARHGLYM